MQIIFIEMETSNKNVVDVSAAGFIRLVLKYFNEDEKQMFHKAGLENLAL